MDAYRTTPTGREPVFDEVLDPGLAVGLDIVNADPDDTVTIQTPEGNEFTYTVTASTELPFRLNLRIRQVLSDGTTLNPADLVLLHA